MNLRILKRARNFLIGCTTIDFSEKTKFVNVNRYQNVRNEMRILVHILIIIIIIIKDPICVQSLQRSYLLLYP
jgi:hypothetical protein